MLSDKLQARQQFVDQRARFERAYNELVQEVGDRLNSPCEHAEWAGRLNTLLMLHAELVNAPVLYTLQSAAEVGFAHAQFTPATEDTKAVKPDGAEDQ